MDHDAERNGLTLGDEASSRPTRFDGGELDEVEADNTMPARPSLPGNAAGQDQAERHAGGLRERPSRSPGSAAVSPATCAAAHDGKRPPPPAPAPPSAFDPLALALLSAFSILGCLCRLGLTALFSYASESVPPLVWSQAVGSFLMGLALANKAGLDSSVLRPALYVGWTTGLCGSITTFSSWMLQTFAAFSNLSGYPRSGVHDAADGVAQIVVTLAVSLFSLSFGRRLALYLPSPRPSARGPSRRAQLAVLVVGLAAYLAAILALALSREAWTGHRVLFALVLAPPGTVLRWWLARLNKRSRRMPTIGTLAANLLATLVLAVGYLLQRVDPVGQGLSVVQCQALQGIEDGFCGSLSTVSTFVTELDALASRSQAEHERLAARAAGNGDDDDAAPPMSWLEREAVWLYAAGSVFCGVAAMVLVLGIGWWASPRGLGPVCAF